MKGAKKPTPQENLTGELISYIRLRLSMSLFPVRRMLLNMDADELANLIRGQAEDVGYGVRDLVLRYFPKQ